MPHIFDRFYQVDSSTRREHEGAGIGLALVKELVELHHGDISVKSEEGKGTEFIVRLPLASDQLPVISDSKGEGREAKGEQLERAFEPATSDQQHANISSIQQSIDPSIQPSSNEQPDDEATIILIIEDNVDMRAYIRQYLEADYKVLEAVDGEQGIATAIAAIPDLVICDVMMPKKDGYEVCRTLKTDEHTSHIPVILLTAKAAPQEKLEGLETGADDYLIKPFDSKELVARVKNLIALRRKLRERFREQVVLKPSDLAVTPPDQAFLEKLMAVMEARMADEDLAVEDLGNAAHLSRAQFHRKLKALTNQSGTQFIQSVRLHRAADLLRQNAGTVAEIAYQVGFGSPSYFTKAFRKYFGKLPSEVVEQ